MIPTAEKSKDVDMIFARDLVREKELGKKACHRIF